MDNAAAVQVGLALLLIALVIASTLLVLGVIAQAIALVLAARQRVTRLSSDAGAWNARVARQLATMRAHTERATMQLHALERTARTQELE